MIFIYLFVYLVIHYLFIYLFSNDWAQYEHITTFALWFTVATVWFTIFAHSCSPTTAMRLARNTLFWSINTILIIGLPPSYISLHRNVHHSSRNIVWLRTCSLNTDNVSGEYCKRKSRQPRWAIIQAAWHTRRTYFELLCHKLWFW